MTNPPPIDFPSMEFDGIYLRRLKAGVLDEIDLEALADEQVVALRCTGFLAPGDPARWASILRPYLPGKVSGERLVDLGCGFGTLTRWLGRELRVCVVGLDRSAVAVTAARMALPQGERDSVDFLIADFAKTGLEKDSARLAVSLDALYLASEPIQTLRELARILIPGGVALFTTYEAEKGLQDDKLPECYSWRWVRLISEAGLELVKADDWTQPWRHYAGRRHQIRWAQRHLLRKEFGPDAEAVLSVTRRMLGLGECIPFLSCLRRFAYLVRKPRTQVAAQRCQRLRPAASSFSTGRRARAR